MSTCILFFLILTLDSEIHLCWKAHYMSRTAAITKVALLVISKNSHPILLKNHFTAFSWTGELPRKISAHNKCTHLYSPKLFLLANKMTRSCLWKLSLLTEMFMVRTTNVWLIHQSRKSFSVCLQTRENTLLYASEIKRWGWSSARYLNYYHFIQEVLILSDAFTVYTQVKGNYCLNKHWVQDLLWRKQNKQKIFIPLLGCVLGIFVPLEHLTTTILLNSSEY